LCTFTIVGVHLYSRSLFKPKIGHVGHRKSADNPNFTCHHCLQRGVSEVRPNDADGDGKCNSDDQPICMIYNNDPVKTRIKVYPPIFSRFTGTSGKLANLVFATDGINDVYSAIA
jgi:hypothetical protein